MKHIKNVVVGKARVDKVLAYKALAKSFLYSKSTESGEYLCSDGFWVDYTFVFKTNEDIESFLKEVKELYAAES